MVYASAANDINAIMYPSSGAKSGKDIMWLTPSSPDVYQGGTSLDQLCVDTNEPMEVGLPMSEANSNGSSLSPQSTTMIGLQPTISGAGKKRKGLGVAGKSIEEEICLICGDRASGYHYNALSCEGCKGFFRRSITRGAEYVCRYGGNCEMDMWMRRRCQACRLKRCREAGMKEECLLSDDQCKARDVRRKARQKVQRRNSGAADQSDMTPDPADSQVKAEVSSPPLTSDPLEALCRNHQELLEKIVLYQDEFELPSEEDVKRVSEVRISETGRPKDVSERIYKHMAEMTVLVTQLVVEFAKCLPGFSDLDREDQIVLLKGSASEVMMLRSARRYDLESDTIIFANGVPFGRENIAMGGLKDYADGMFAFCASMARLGVDNAEYALITAICIFSERPSLGDPAKVEVAQEMYVACLREYELHRRPKGSNFLAKLLMKLTELRTLSIEHSDMLFSLKVEKGSLPPLLSEYFDIDDRK